MNHRQHRALSAAKRQTLLLTGNPIWRALNRAPIEQAEQIDLALAARAAFDEIVHGRGLDDHVDTIACVANVSLVLAERGFGPECEPKIIEAREAVMRIKARQQRGQRIGLDGPGAQALRDLMDTHEAQIEHAGRAELAAALIEVRQRAAQGHVMRVAA
jgi:hypothetical protein